jgi:hypothetical protein
MQHESILMLKKKLPRAGFRSIADSFRSQEPGGVINISRGAASCKQVKLIGKASLTARKAAEPQPDLNFELWTWDFGPEIGSVVDRYVSRQRLWTARGFQRLLRLRTTGTEE